ncbi:uncharacterized protein [Rutidosis leptorrhynchoides]|uniref:uncharacterized protein n=1 Tax=Rutidosis leptorrhynchoides TaxID=125765 RepID=UPI003A9A347C
MFECGVLGHDTFNCSFKDNVCWNFHKEGHRSACFPSASRSGFVVGSGARSTSVGRSSASTAGQKRKNPPTAEARAFQMTVNTATATDEVMTGMFLVNSLPARVFFDSRAKNSFMSLGFSDNLKLLARILDELLRIKVADVVGMNWLSSNRASINYDKQMISFPLADVSRVVARGKRDGFNFPMVSQMKARKAISKGCDSFLAYVIDVKKEKKQVTDILVVPEFPVVFPYDLPGLPPVLEVEYKVDLVPGATQVEKAPYILAPS